MPGLAGGKKKARLNLAVQPGLVMSRLFLRDKRILAHAAHRANPRVGNVLELGAGRHAAIGIADFGIIDITTNRT